jgi:hypothetical protein
MDAFRKFDRVGIKLKHVGMNYLFGNHSVILGELAQSQQSKYIQRLILMDIIFFSPLEIMANMEALTSLDISFRTTHDEDVNGIKTTINFSQLIEACPVTLKDLAIEDAKLKFNESTSNLTSIQILRLENVEITEEATITGTSVPKLSVLYLSVFIDCDLTVSLPSHHLKKARIKIKYPQG